ncbi:MAG: hypothetical protein J6R82_05530 [Clostridia bacterium]|nr:hypothetical protein [Clostridia bacterium]
MTITIPGLKEERLCISDAHHSQIITQDNPTFTLTEGEEEFTVEQIATTSFRTPFGWGLYLLSQILTALPRAISFRTPIFQRCNPIMLRATVKVNSFRFSDLTLFLDAGGYNQEVHSYQPPRLSGDKELTIRIDGYSCDTDAVETAIREESMSKIGYCTALLSLPLILLLLSYLTNFGIFFAAALGLLPFLIALCIFARIHSRHVKQKLREKVEDTLRHLGDEM